MEMRLRPRPIDFIYFDGRNPFIVLAFPFPPFPPTWITGGGVIPPIVFAHLVILLPLFFSSRISHFSLLSSLRPTMSTPATAAPANTAASPAAATPSAVPRTTGAPPKSNPHPVINSQLVTSPCGCYHNSFSCS